MVSHIMGGQSLHRVGIFGVEDRFFRTLKDDLVIIDQAAGDHSTAEALDALLDGNSGQIVEKYKGLSYREDFPSIKSITPNSKPPKFELPGTL